MSKSILVTGGNSGIGLALCKLLATQHGCHVFLGSRSKEKGTAAVESITSAHSDAKVELLQIDVNDEKSCADACAALKAKGVTLYGLVNNAGVGLAHGDLGAEPIINTNFKGPRRVTEALVEVIDPKEGRIVNTSSGVASTWLKAQDAGTKAIFSSPETTMDQLDAAVQKHLDAKNFLSFGKGYGLSKAALTTLTMVHAAKYPNLKVVSLSPGFIDTPMTKGFGAKLTPEQGCVSSLKCLFEPVTSGYYYGSDGLRSPLTVSRDPGMPEYEGEPDPDPTKYNK